MLENFRANTLKENYLTFICHDFENFKTKILTANVLSMLPLWKPCYLLQFVLEGSKFT